MVSMSSSVVTIALLVAFIVMTSLNAIRMWRGKTGFLIRPLTPSYRKTFECQKWLAINSISTFVWWSFAIMGASAYGLKKRMPKIVHLAFYVPVAVGFALFIGTLIIGLSIFLSGKPVRCIPSQFRDAAAHKWDDGPKFL